LAPGGSTKTREAKAEGKPGIAITEVVKVGQGVEVKYHEQGMHAASVRVLPSVPKGDKGPAAAPAAGAKPAGGAAKAATGVVSAVSPSSLTVKGGSVETTFMIDEKTKVIGAGLGSAARKKQAAGDKTPITDFVADGDTVRVMYHEMDGMKHASEVRVTKKHR
jgi:hypothetical protein